MARLQKLVDDGSSEVLGIRSDDFSTNATSHGIQELFETGIISQPEERHLGVEPTYSIELSHGGL